MSRRRRRRGCCVSFYEFTHLIIVNGQNRARVRASSQSLCVVAIVALRCPCDVADIPESTASTLEPKGTLANTAFSVKSMSINRRARRVV